MALRTGRVRIELYGMGASRGPGTLKAIIDDAANVGVSEHANDAGEMFFTIPYNHPAAAQVDPLETHYRVLRLNASETYTTVGVGLIEDFEADKDEIVVYGVDYRGLLTTTMTGFNTSYTNAALGTIVTAQLSAARVEANSRLAFTSVGTIDATAATATLLTSYQVRLDFLRQVAEVSMSDRSVRTLLRISRDSPYTWTFVENYGSDKPTYRMEWGGAVSNFQYVPGFRDFATRVASLGVKREGASILVSQQTSASETTYGWIVKPHLVIDVTDQAALDRITLRQAKIAGRVDKNVLLELVSGNIIAPVDGWEIGDSLPVIISRGDRVNVNGYYTIWGWEWIVPPNGQELLYLSIATKET